MNNYLQDAKLKFEEDGFLLLPDVSNISFDVSFNKFDEPLHGSYVFSEINLPNNITDVLKIITGKTVTKGKLVQINHKDYKLIKEINTDYFAVLELTEEWNSDFGGNVVLADGEGEHLEIPFLKGSFFLSEVYPLWYISYCNHYSIDNRRVIVIEF